MREYVAGEEWFGGRHMLSRTKMDALGLESHVAVLTQAGRCFEEFATTPLLPSTSSPGTVSLVFSF